MRPGQQLLAVASAAAEAAGLVVVPVSGLVVVQGRQHWVERVKAEVEPVEIVVAAGRVVLVALAAPAAAEVAAAGTVVAVAADAAGSWR